MFGSSSFGQKSSHFGSQKTNVAPKPIGLLFDSTTSHRQNSSPSGPTSSFFGPSSSPELGTSPAFERNTAEFGQKQKPGFRQTRPAFGTPSTQAFGTTSSSERTTSTFGATNTTGFGASGTFGFSPCCGNSAACPFRDPSSQSKFGQSVRSSPSFRQSESSSFGQSFGASSTSRSLPSLKKSAASPFGTQNFPSKFGQSNLGGRRQVPSARTTEWDPLSHEPVMFQSISAMKAYEDRSHEELRWEDYRGREKTQTARDAGFSSADFENNRQSDRGRKDQKINEKLWLAETLDTEIKRWASGKEENLRALLLNLQHILGPDSGWKPISLTDRTASVEVKKAYRQATLHVHPDKLQQRGASSRQKYICERVFHLLQAAWSKFNR